MNEWLESIGACCPCYVPMERGGYCGCLEKCHPDVADLVRRAEKMIEAKDAAVSALYLPYVPIVSRAELEAMRAEREREKCHKETDDGR